jgi:hypothetical protein
MELQTTQRAAPLTLETLPADIHLLIFDILHINSSVCLGLTCKYFYDTHYHIYGNVLLDLRDTRIGSAGLDLVTLLMPWMLPIYTHTMAMPVPTLNGGASVFFRFMTLEQADAVKDKGDETRGVWLYYHRSQ